MASSPNSPPPRRAEQGLESPAADTGAPRSDVFERATIAPPFDLEEFAREKMSQPEERLSLPDTPTMPPPLSGSHDRPDPKTLSEDELVQHLGSLGRVASLAVAASELRTLAVDHRGAFLLSQIDGLSTIEMILDVCGMSRLDALRILAELVQQGIVTLD